MLTESWVEGKSVEEKDAQSTERTAALWGLSSKIDSRIWVNFTRNGLRLGSRYHEPPHTYVFKEFGYSCHQRRLTWAKEKKNWTVTQWSKVLFSDQSKFCISFGNQGPRVWRKGGEAHSPSCLKSCVKFPQSLMIWGAMSSAGVGPLCFFENQRHCTRLPICFGVLHASKRPKMQMSWRPLSKKPGFPYHLSSATNWPPLNLLHCALNLFNTRVSQFELNYWNKWTFPRHSYLLRCTCIWVFILCGACCISLVPCKHKCVPWWINKSD